MPHVSRGKLTPPGASWGWWRWGKCIGLRCQPGQPPGRRTAGPQVTPPRRPAKLHLAMAPSCPARAGVSARDAFHAGWALKMSVVTQVCGAADLTAGGTATTPGSPFLCPPPLLCRGSHLSCWTREKEREVGQRLPLHPSDQRSGLWKASQAGACSWKEGDRGKGYGKDAQ